MSDESGGDRAPTARASDGAAFVPQRIGSGRRAPPLLVWVVALGGVVAIGFAGRAGTDGGGQGNASPAPRTTAPAILGEAAARGAGAPPATARPITRNPRASTDEGPVHLELVRTSASIFVHADVHASHVAWVFVQVQTDSGRVAGWASMSFPGSVDPPADATSEAPALRFDVELVIPEDMRGGRLWTQVNVYDNLGARVATTRLAVPTPGADDTLEPEFLRGFRPTGPPWNREMAGG